MKLFTIGDSVSQGFMSLASARTDLSFSTLIARHMNLGAGYRFPEWGMGGLPINLEDILRRLVRRYGSNIRGLEWLTMLQTINGVIDTAEDYYERGAGAVDKPYRGVTSFHNAAVQGFDVADSWMVTPRLCKQRIRPPARILGDVFLSGPSDAFYRTALRVLNPSLDPKYEDHSQLTWLEEHASGEGVENLLLWLGANNALGTILGLKIYQTPNDSKRRPNEADHDERQGWNLWHPDDFEAEYRELLDRVDAAMKKNKNDNWNVFAGTVPLVTIAPLAKGVGPTYRITRENRITKQKDVSTYYKYYTYFPFEEDAILRSDLPHLTLQEVVHIDDCIREYNNVILELVGKKNEQHGRKRYYVVDIARTFRDIAFKRNEGQVQYKFPKDFDFAYPKVDTKYYHADPDGRLRQGGLSGLDGVHPSAIGQGLIAWEYLKVMEKAGVVNGSDLDWRTIFASDTLYSAPITLMQEIYEHSSLAEHLIKLIQGIQRLRD